jgi:cellulose synthase/poly-beta-1,6-N-acetylglucosamine synthase-like glycosyltransferase
MVSVIIPCWGQKYRLLLPRALKSVHQQSYKPIETIIISEYNTISTALNEGFKKSSGEYVCFLGADDELHPLFVETTLRYMRDNVGFVWTGTQEKGSSNKIKLPYRFPTGRLRIYCGFGGQVGCALFRRAAFKEVGGFDESLTGGEDYDLCRRIVKAGWECVGIDDILHFSHVDVPLYRKHKGLRNQLYRKYPELRLTNPAFRLVRKIGVKIGLMDPLRR